MLMGTDPMSILKRYGGQEVPDKILNKKSPKGLFLFKTVCHP